MMVNVVMLPAVIEAGELSGHEVVVFDVLRATTSMTAALAAGAAGLWLFSSVDEARAAVRPGSPQAVRPGSPQADQLGLPQAAVEADRPLLAGEIRAVRPEGFDLGNSPGEYTAQRVSGRRVFMATTNGTKAILACAAAGSEHVWAGALVNASAVARRVTAAGTPVTLVCSGTYGKVSLEDVLGAGAVMAAMREMAAIEPGNDAAVMALELYEAMRGDLAGALRRGQGGKNVHAAHLDADVEFAARLDSLDVVGLARGTPWVVRRAE
jgi:2-phosphosulfolactate phosphatase